MKFVVTGGGTAGHVNPALAVAQEMRLLGHEVLYAGTPNGLEANLIPQEGFSYTGFKASGFNRRKPLSLLSSSAKIAMSTFKASAWLKAVKPDAVVGFGGFVSIPICLAASWRKIPLVIHEQNSAIGMANRFLAKRAQLIAFTYASAADSLTLTDPAASNHATSGPAESGHAASKKVIVTGNPVRASLFEVDRIKARESFGLAPDAIVLLVFGGSLGALHLNQALVSHAEELLSHTEIQVLHITGTRDYEMIRTMVADIPQTEGRWFLIEYCERMGEAYAAADAVLSRAGATTLAEIGALGKPALLIPFPHAAADEQTSNAKSLVDGHAADMLADSELDEPVFFEKLLRLVSDEAYRKSMQEALRSLGNARARQELTRNIIELVSGEC